MDASEAAMTTNLYRRYSWVTLALVVAWFGCGRTELSRLNMLADAGNGGYDGGAVGLDGSTGSGGTLGTGGVVGKGGSSQGSGGMPGTGGVVGKGGSSQGSGGMPGTGGVIGACAACQSLEVCWDSKLCVAESVPATVGLFIDATEVTRGQYSAWLATKPSAIGQESNCAWNTTFLPDSTCMARGSVCQGAGCAQHPQVCVDQCDAFAYCSSVGKSLCGAFGGGSVPPASMRDPEKSKWHNACSSSGSKRITYGDSMIWGICNDATSGLQTTTPVGSKAACRSDISGYAGVYDLIGNVWEWEDNCNGSAGASDRCVVRGGSFGRSAAYQDCDLGLPQSRSDFGDNVGFRCCGL
jgi:sulfatase modifying factor 1